MFRTLKIAILLLFLQPQISNTIVWMAYELDKEYITEAYCVNKEKPQLKCNGQCHLAKQLTNVDPVQSEQPAQINYIPQIQLFYQEIEQPIVEQEFNSLASENFSLFYSFQPFSKVYHPPQV